MTRVGKHTTPRRRGSSHAVEWVGSRPVGWVGWVRGLVVEGLPMRHHRSVATRRRIGKLIGGRRLLPGRLRTASRCLSMRGSCRISRFQVRLYGSVGTRRQCDTRPPLHQMDSGGYSNADRGIERRRQFGFGLMLSYWQLKAKANLNRVVSSNLRLGVTRTPEVKWLMCL